MLNSSGQSPSFMLITVFTTSQQRVKRNLAIMQYITISCRNVEISCENVHKLWAIKEYFVTGFGFNLVTLHPILHQFLYTVYIPCIIIQFPQF
jgi:hypothetical protein